MEQNLSANRNSISLNFQSQGLLRPYKESETSKVLLSENDKISLFKIKSNQMEQIATFSITPIFRGRFEMVFDK